MEILSTIEDSKIKRYAIPRDDDGLDTKDEGTYAGGVKCWTDIVTV